MSRIGRRRGEDALEEGGSISDGIRVFEETGEGGLAQSFILLLQPQDAVLAGAEELLLRVKIRQNCRLRH